MTVTRTELSAALEALAAELPRLTRLYYIPTVRHIFSGQVTKIRSKTSAADLSYLEERSEAILHAAGITASGGVPCDDRR